LAEQDLPVTVVSRSFNPWLLDRLESFGQTNLIEAAITPSRELGRLIAASDAVIFLAGASTPSHADQNVASSTLDSVMTALTVLDLMRNAGVRRIVLASSGGTIYGEPGRLPTPESHPLEPISVHGLNSVITERYARFFAVNYGFEVTVLRYSNVYGPGQTGRRGQGVVAAWCRALALGEPVTIFGSLDLKRDFVYADDAADATVAALTAPCGTYNVGSGHGSSLAEVLDLVLTSAGRTLEVRREPWRGLDVSATALDCSRLRAETGWFPRTSLSAGVRSSWEWLSERLAASHGTPTGSRAG
jgi:UDP-glucose 4-epimerase